MNAIIHIICNGYQEFWLDGHEVEKVEKHWFDPRKYGASATITYKDGHTEEFESVIMVIVEHERDLCENIPADPEELKKAIDDFNKEAQSAQDKFLDSKMADFMLSVRTLNCLKANNIETVRDLVRLHKTDWLKFRTSGKKSLTELDEFITAHNLEWGMDV